MRKGVSNHDYAGEWKSNNVKKGQGLMNSAEGQEKTIDKTPKKSKSKDIDWSAHKLEKRNVEDLKPNPNNARLHDEEQVNQIAASIKEWGYTTPILIDDNNQIIAGHGRWMACRQLKAKEVPVIVATGWTDAQKRAYAIADNQLALNSEWDDDLLKIELGSLIELKFDVGLTGFPDPMKDLGFSPGLEPTSTNETVTEQDVESAQEELGDTFKDAGKQNLADILCPHCNAVFKINKDSL